AMLPESGGGEPRLVSKALLGSSGAGAYALDVSHQMEGYAAARVRLPIDGRREIRYGTPIQNVEVAWENYIDGTSGRATIPDAGPIQPDDVKVVGGREVLANALLSVSLRSVFVRPHAPTVSSLTFLLDPAGHAQRFDYPKWPGATDAYPPPVFGDLA